MSTPRPSHDLGAEKAALNMLIVEGSVEIANILLPEDFYDEVNRDIFVASRESFRKYEKCDLTYLGHVLEGNSRFQSAGGMNYLVEAIATPYTPTIPIPTIEILKNMRVLRERRMTVEEMAKYKPKDLPQFLLDEGRKYAELVPKSGEVDKSLLISELTMTEDVIPTGFVDMDLLLEGGGLTEGMVFVVAARPSVGKTSLATSMMANFLRDGHSVHFISLEMSRKHVLTRVLCAANGLTTAGVKESASELVAALTTPFSITTESNDLGSIEAEVLSCPEEVVILDYMDLVTIKNREGRIIQLDEISRGIKNLARNAKKPIVLLRQLNREMEKAKENREPNMSDLFGAGEKDADVISFLWDPETKREKEAQDIVGEKAAELGAGAQNNTRSLKWIVRKNRNGPVGYVDLTFIPEQFSFLKTVVASQSDLPI